MAKQYLSEELLARIKGIQLKARHLVNNTFAGEYQSAFRGRGMEFDEIREYSPGDDIRSIDWNVTARTGNPYVKVYRDERELMVMFVVDVSVSTYFGSGQRFKSEVAAEIAALLAYTALRNNDKVGLAIFSDQVEHFVPPKKGRGHVWQLIRDILTHESTMGKTDISGTLEYLNRVVKHRAIVFLISDFLGVNDHKLMQITSKRHDLIAITLVDPRERELPAVGMIELEDAETGERLLLDTYQKSIREKFRNRTAKEEKRLVDFFRSSQIDHIPIHIDKSYIDAIIKFFRTRDRRFR